MENAKIKPVGLPGSDRRTPLSQTGGAPPQTAVPFQTTGPSAEDLEMATVLRVTFHRMIKQLRRETRNDARLSQTERSTLGLLDLHGELLPSDIARMEKVTTQSVSQVVNHLTELKYIGKRASEEDRRKVLISLTEEGKVYLEQMRQDKQEWLAKSLYEKMSPEEKQLLMEAVKLMTKLMDE